MSDTELKPLWSDNKSEEDIINSTPIGASPTVYNLLEDIKCLKEYHTSLKDELIVVINTMKFYSPQESEYVIKADVVIEAIKELDK